MKLTFAPPNDGKAHSYCVRCHQETVQPIMKPHSRHAFRCESCGCVEPRAIIFDPEVKWWLDDQLEHWHETAGVLVRNHQAKLLLFLRTRFPYLLSIPAGHLKDGEAPEKGASRELSEETGLDISPKSLLRLDTWNIVGDECRRGADAHRWHSFSYSISHYATVRINPQEGVRPVWLSPVEALGHVDLTLATRQAIQRRYQ